MIIAENLKKEFKFYVRDDKRKNKLRRSVVHKVALDSVSLNINKGEIVGIAGSNGAGKTTLLKIMAGILKPTNGKIEVNGIDPFGATDSFKKNISIILGQKSQLWWDLPAKDSINLNRVIYDVPQKTFQYIYNELLDVLSLRDLQDVPVRRLSLGERMKFEIIAGIIHNPKIVFLDEPTIGLDLISQNNIRDFLKFYNKQFGATILLTSHYMQDIYEVCDRLVLLQSGKKIYDDKISSLMDTTNKKVILKLADKENENKFLQENDNVVYNDLNHEICFWIERNHEKKIIDNIIQHYKYEDISIQNASIEEIIRKKIEK